MHYNAAIMYLFAIIGITKSNLPIAFIMTSLQNDQNFKF